MNKQILIFILISFASSSLYARKITIIKAESAHQIKSFDYISYYETSSNQIIGSKLNKINFGKNNAINFSIDNRHTHLEIMWSSTINNILTSKIMVKKGENPLTYKLSFINNKLVLAPMILRQK